jgi:hypothetical protein
MDDAFRKFLEAFNQRPGALPPITPPWMYAFPATPMGNNPQSPNATR